MTMLRRTLVGLLLGRGSTKLAPTSFRAAGGGFALSKFGWLAARCAAVVAARSRSLHFYLLHRIIFFVATCCRYVMFDREWRRLAACLTQLGVTQ